MAGDQTVDCVPNGRGHELGQLDQSPRSAKVGRHTQGRGGMREDSFLIRPVGRFDKQHGVEPAHFGVPLENGATRGAIERGKSKRSVGIARENELNALGAEAAGPVVQKDW
jgi:hypothetical protein